MEKAVVSDGTPGDVRDSVQVPRRRTDERRWFAAARFPTGDDAWHPPREGKKETCHPS